MNASKRFVVTAAAMSFPILLDACNRTASDAVDMTPVGTGIQFLDIALILATLIVVLDDSLKTTHMRWIIRYAPIHISPSIFCICVARGIFHEHRRDIAEGEQILTRPGVPVGKRSGIFQLRAAVPSHEKGEVFGLPQCSFPPAQYLA